jgi:hypothetical protein
MCDLQCESRGTSFHTLNPEEIETLKFRFDFPVKVLCPEHYRQQFSLYPMRQNKCSDPCLRHSKPAKWRLCEITLDLANKVKESTEHRVIPGQKLCYPCVAHLKELITTNDDPPGHDDSPAVEFDSPM